MRFDSGGLTRCTQLPWPSTIAPHALGWPNQDWRDASDIAPQEL